MGLNGHILEISTAVCLQTIVVSQILQLNLSGAESRHRKCLKLSQIATALKECASALDLDYRQLRNRCHPKRSLQAFFPDPTPKPGPDAVAFPSLKFKAYLDLRNGVVEEIGDPTPSEMRSPFVADMSPDDDDKTVEVVVKFSASYCETAHRLLAEAGLAPKLFECRRVISNWFMVMTERLDLGWRPMSSFEDKVIVSSVFKDVENAVKILSDSNFVHGNLRASNIMVDPSGRHAKLVGFDWACKEGENFYPVTIGENDAYRELHPDAANFAKMKKEHDVYALENILKPRYMSRRID